MNSSLQTIVSEILSEFEKVWSLDGQDLLRPSTEETLRQLIQSRTPAELRPRVQAEFFGLGPLPALLNDPDIQEIIVMGPDEVWFEKSGAMQAHIDRFLSAITFRQFIDRICAEAQIKVDLAQPFADGRWRQFRVHLGCAPLTHCSFHLNLRRISESPWTLDRLHDLGWCDSRGREALQNLIETRQNFILIGPTGCGKTSVLSACLRELSPNERVVIIEDTDELPRPNLVSTKLLARPNVGAALGEISLTELVKQSLRMRPSRVVMGEVRGAEAKDLLLALATGHSGSLGTLHAESARQALLRLEMLVQLGAPQWSAQTVRQLIQLSVSHLVVCENECGHRRLQGIYKVAALESFGFLLESVL